MGIIKGIKRWFGMLFAGKAKEVFEVKNIVSNSMESYVSKCVSIYKGKPEWLDPEHHIKTVNFAQFICAETAKLSTLGMSVIIDGPSERIRVIQEQIDEAKANFRQWVEYASAYGTVILKPNGKTIDCVLPDRYMITDHSNGKITGIVFISQETSENGKTFYTKLEYHRYIDSLYVITNKCYKGKTEKDVAELIPIEESPWNYCAEEFAIENMSGMLFGVLRMPNGNSIDEDSPIAMPLFANAIEELKDLDIAYSRNAKEIYDSKRTVLLDADRLINQNPAGLKMSLAYRRAKAQMGLPDYVQIVEGINDASHEGMYQEINPSLQTTIRLEGINSLLSQIGFKCGFSNGYFVFNASTGFATATQVTADQARTIKLIDDIRSMIDVCLIDLIKAINVFEDIYGTTGHVDITDTVSTSELDRIIHVHFEPIFTNKEEDRARALQLTQSGFYPKWYYLHMYEGLDEETAKALTSEAGSNVAAGLFDE